MIIAYVILLDDYVFSNIVYDYIMSFCYMKMSAIIFNITICYVILLDDYVFYIIVYDYMLCHFDRWQYVFYIIIYDYILCYFARQLSFL